MIRILGIAGSLRRGSYNRAALNAAMSLCPPETELMIYDGLANIPLFNQDYEQQMPESVVDFKRQIRAADAIIFATPEYNYSYPGVLKNAIDWASRPYGDSAWYCKPVALMSASVGMLGGARAQYHLRQAFVFLNMFPLNQPEVIIPEAASKFDAQGSLTDAHTKEKIKDLVETLVVWTRKLKVEMPVKMQSIREAHPYDDAYSDLHPNLKH